VHFELVRNGLLEAVMREAADASGLVVLALFRGHADVELEPLFVGFLEGAFQACEVQGAQVYPVKFARYLQWVGGVRV